MGQIIIRPANQSDYPAIARLHAESWQVAYKSFLPPSYLRDRVAFDVADYWRQCRLKPDDILLVAVDRTDQTLLLGFIAVWCRPSAYIDNLHCAPGHTAKGIGRMLMKQAFEQLKLRNKKNVSLSVIVGNVRAKKFYLRLGGVSLGARRGEIFSYPVDVETITWETLSPSEDW